MIEIKNLVKQFGRLRAVDDVSLTVGKGKVVVVIGPSGSGKSTVLRCINHLETPTSGEITIDGIKLTHNHKDINAIRAEVGMVFQQFNLFPHLTALQNVMLAQRTVRRRSEDEARKIGMTQLERVGIPEKANSFPSQLSGGQQQRVAIARALVHEPRLVICDEPTAALDSETGHKIMELLQDIAAASSRCVIIVTHDPRIFKYANRTTRMDDGCILPPEPEEVLERTI